MWEVALMAKPGTTSQKRQREAEKAAKAKAKRERRQQAKDENDVTSADGPPAQPSAVVLDRLAALHRRFEAAEISFEDYEEAKAALLGQLRVE